MVELLFPLTLKRGYERRDLYTLEVLVCGVWSVKELKVRYICLPI